MPAISLSRERTAGLERLCEAKEIQRWAHELVETAERDWLDAAQAYEVETENTWKWYLYSRIQLRRQALETAIDIRDSAESVVGRLVVKWMKMK